MFSAPPDPLSTWRDEFPILNRTIDMIGNSFGAMPASRGLKARDVLVDYRPGVGIRVSPHFYNTFEELESLVDTLGGVLAERAFGEAPSTRVT